MVLASGIAEDLRRIDYFDWSRDWTIVVQQAAILAVVGATLGFFAIALVIAVRKAIVRR